MLARAAAERADAGPAESRVPVAENVCTVVANRAVDDRTRQLVLAAPAPALAARPGQFFHLLCPATGDGRPFLRRPMSVYRVERARRRVAFLYKGVGAGTRAMAALRPGDRFDILGPLGTGFALHPAWRHVVALGRGVGLATLAPLVEAACARGIAVTAILSAATPARLLSAAALARAGAEVIAVSDAAGTSDPADVEAILARLIAAGRADAFFTCGSDRLMRLMQRLAARHGIPGQVALEQQMACGLGMCFCCVRPFVVAGRIVHRRVCCEGPVFDLQEALSW